MCVNYIYKANYTIYIKAAANSFYSYFLFEIPHSSPGDSRCENLSCLRFREVPLFSNGIGTHRANPIMKNRYGAICSENVALARQQSHPNSIATKRLDRANRRQLTLRTDRSCRSYRETAFFFRTLWNDRHGARFAARNESSWLDDKKYPRRDRKHHRRRSFRLFAAPLIRERTQKDVLSFQRPSRLCTKCARAWEFRLGRWVYGLTVIDCRRTAMVCSITRPNHLVVATLPGTFYSDISFRPVPQLAL